MKFGLLGKKIGMTRVYDETGRLVTVTVIDAADNTLLQVRTMEKDGYSAVQIGYADQKEQRVPKPLLGHFKKAGSAPKRYVREFRLDAGDSIAADTPVGLDRFETGQYVDVIGTSKGKGFQGVVKRYRFAGQPQSHGSMMHRRTGAIGNRSTPGLVKKNTRMPGQHGNRRITLQNLKVVQVRKDDGLILISGAIPGANGTYVIVRPAKKKPLPVAAA